MLVPFAFMHKFDASIAAGLCAMHMQAEADEVAARIQQTERECRALMKHLGSLVGTNTEMNQHYR